MSLRLWYGQVQNIWGNFFFNLYKNKRPFRSLEWAYKETDEPDARVSMERENEEEVRTIR